MVLRNHILWVAWQHHLRNETISRSIGAYLHEMSSRLPRPGRYVVLGLRTSWLLLRNRKAQAVIAQDPSIALAYLTVIIGRALDMRVAVDAHNAALDPPGGRIVGYAARKLLGLTPLTIVTNEALAVRVRLHGGRAVVVPDPIPEWTSDAATDPTLVTVISGWGRDEPIAEVVAAAGFLADLDITITGTPDHRMNGLSVPSNLRLTGRLPQADYIDHLARSAVVVNLTTREDCLVCGASEALALERPMVLSDSDVLRQRFGDVATFTTSTAEAIAAAIRTSLANGSAGDPAALRRRLDAEWIGHRDDLLHALARARRRRVRTWNLRRENG